MKSEFSQIIRQLKWAIHRRVWSIKAENRAVGRTYLWGQVLMLTFAPDKTQVLFLG